ncbi:putative isochorismatase family protein family [Diaporthe ampelina]|uniref:Putative isochorismatase family protein family n=1 Tax=Diaporthe ampelina TaxID=1214573 RepID=A0A0G2F8J8_9PEZI|nr:putative isochorismatase family protein family [Diaporthe ampelina]
MRSCRELIEVCPKNTRYLLVFVLVWKNTHVAFCRIVMSVLPINPADFPDVPTKKALIAIDFQNDFLADDGALPVSQPDGMIAKVVRLADAVRNSGYGEVVWVRSQFDTSRAVGEQQMMAMDAPQLPNRPGGSAAAAAARARAPRPSPTPSTPLEADPEAFLSDLGQQAGKPKPQCVRKGTKGAELLPELAAAKGSRDYAMTKTYYSAFQSGQLLQLLRRHFATELYICGALSNVSVYATALAASSYGFDITIVEDCCGYRSEARHMNATRKLAEMTGCEFATVADIVPTLRPRPQSRTGCGRDGREQARSQQGHYLTASEKPKPTKMDQAEFVPTEELLTAETPDYQKEGSYPAGDNGKEPKSVTEGSITRGPGDSKTGSQDSSSKLTETENLCEGDTTIIHSFLPDSLGSGLFERLCSEVHFQKMMHQGGEVPRFVAVQGEILEDGAQPIYRHPSDEALLCVPFTPAVEAIRTEVEAKVGHKVNHVLIQCYRSGNDYISEHSDKTLDVVPGSYIANVSLGAERTMAFRTKRDASTEKENLAKEKKEASPPSTIKGDPEPPKIADDSSPSKRQTIRCRMPHNSLVRMGLATNSKWLHGIRPDKRPTSQKSHDELAFGGYRISLTFRHIGTFLSPTDIADEPVIWGQGAVSKTRDGARPVINGQTPEAVALLKAFGKENHSSEFDWEEAYGGGFDVLHMKAAPRYFGCGDTMIDGRVKIMLAELGAKYAHGSIGTGKGNRTNHRDPSDVVPVKLVLDDADRTTITGDVAIMLYLDARHPKKKGTEADMARVFTRFQAALALGQKWKALALGTLARDIPKEEKVKLISDFASVNYVQINDWMAENLRPLWADEGGDEHGDLFFAGNGAGGQQQPTIADYALWPVLYDITETWRAADARFEQSWAERARYTALEKYWVDFAGRKSVVEVFGRNVAWLSNRPGAASASGKAEQLDEKQSGKDAGEDKGEGGSSKNDEAGEKKGNKDKQKL